MPKKIPEKETRLNITIRLPRSMIEWLRKHPRKAGVIVEAAVNEWRK